jgi:hypothetical protein
VASGDASVDPGRNVGRSDNACADRDNAGVEPPHVREFFPMMGIPLAHVLWLRNQSGMALTPDQERVWFAQLEALSVPLVRSDLESGKISPAFVHATAVWLSAKDKEAEERREASNSAQIALARRAAEAAEQAASEAHRASTVAGRSATAAERQAAAAERANSKATIAIVIAAISLIVAIVASVIPLLSKH